VDRDHAVLAALRAGEKQDPNDDRSDLTLAFEASIVAGATVGGLIIDGPGFWALGVFCFVAATLAAAVVWLFVREEFIDLEIAPAV